ncbi:hypothetical protein Dimus_019740 [Dionaea muscipula]
MFGREGSGLRLRKEALVSTERQEERKGGLPYVQGGNFGASVIHRGVLNGGRLLSFKNVLQGGQKDIGGVGRVGGSAPPSVVIKGESHGVERLRRSCVIEWEEGFRMALFLDGAWWASRGVTMTPWTEDLVILPMREDFACRVVEERSATMHQMQDHTFVHGCSRFGFSWEVNHGLGSIAGDAIASPKVEHGP